MAGEPTAGETSNHFGGRAETVIQARDVTYHHHHAPAPPPVPDPHQVPPGTPLFVNRTDDLADLRGWLDPDVGGPPRMALLTGLPGVGKRSTARRWAEDTRGRYPGGELYIDFAELRGPSGGGDLFVALERCLRALGVADRYLPTDLGELIALYRTRTAGRGVLVVLDNVTSPAHVRTLLPAAPGSAVLATSGRRLGELVLDGARLLPLEPLSAHSGARLLTDLCGPERIAAEPEAAARLVEGCGGLPAALHLAAARLLIHRRLTVAALVAELEQESGGLAALALDSANGMSVLLGIACRDLPADALRLYRRLGLLPGRGFDAETAAAADGTDPATARRLLDVLDAASLLEDAMSDRHRLHDLVRRHARDRAESDEPAAEREAALGRIVDHYTVRAAFADRAVMGNRLRITDHEELLTGHEDPFAGPGARDTALDWLEAERADALAVLRAAAAHGLDRRVWQLAESLTALYLHHRHLADWIESGTLGAEAAARTGEQAAEARLRSLLSRPLMDTGDHDRAREELEAATTLADASGHPVLRASVREFAGRYWDRYDPARAVRVYVDSLALNVAADEPRGAALARFFMGGALIASGDREAGLAALTEAYEALSALGDVRMAGRALAALGRHAHSAEALERAAEMLRETRAGHYEAEVREELADLLERSGHADDAREHLERAVELLAAGGSPRAGELRERLLSISPSGGHPAPPAFEERGPGRSPGKR
ncbi:tetratricopeptide repeat protein [Streptomyces abikoensis]|uniref:tetratricopeptide repeat protein n=1 Tax=Streptomyces TaxID=1883 RepID=UPI0033F00883